MEKYLFKTSDLEGFERPQLTSKFTKAFAKRNKLLEGALDEFGNCTSAVIGYSNPRIEFILDYDNGCFCSINNGAPFYRDEMKNATCYGCESTSGNPENENGVGLKAFCVAMMLNPKEGVGEGEIPFTLWIGVENHKPCSVFMLTEEGKDKDITDNIPECLTELIPSLVNKVGEHGTIKYIGNIKIDEKIYNGLQKHLPIAIKNKMEVNPNFQVLLTHSSFGTMSIYGQDYMYSKYMGDYDEKNNPDGIIKSGIYLVRKNGFKGEDVPVSYETVKLNPEKIGDNLINIDKENGLSNPNFCALCSVEYESGSVPVINLGCVPLGYSSSNTNTYSLNRTKIIIHDLTDGVLISDCHTVFDDITGCSQTKNTNKDYSYYKKNNNNWGYLEGMMVKLRSDVQKTNGSEDAVAVKANTEITLINERLKKQPLFTSGKTEFYGELINEDKCKALTAKYDDSLNGSGYKTITLSFNTQSPSYKRTLKNAHGRNTPEFVIKEKTAALYLYLKTSEKRDKERSMTEKFINIYNTSDTTTDPITIAK